MRVKFGNPLISTLEGVICDAQEELIIISPFIALKDEYKEFVESCLGKSLKITIIMSPPKNNNMDWVELFYKDSVELEVYHLEDLHAKVYINESYALLTSKNLYEKDGSLHNEEIGVTFSSNEEEYESMMKYVDRLTGKADLVIRHKQMISL